MTELVCPRCGNKDINKITVQYKFKTSKGEWALDECSVQAFLWEENESKGIHNPIEIVALHCVNEECFGKLGKGFCNIPLTKAEH